MRAYLLNPLRTSRVRRGWIVAPVLATLLLGACDDNGTSPRPDPTIGVALGAATLSVVQGQSGTVPVTVTRGGGYTGAVALTLEGAPAGVAGSFAPASLGAGVTGSTLTVNAGASVAPGVYPLTVRASGQGVTAQTASLSLTVAEPPGIGVQLNPTTLAINQGDSATVTATITRTGGFTGAVELLLEGAPTGVTGTFTPATLPAGTTSGTLRLRVASGAAAGASTLTVRARGPGVADRTASLQLTVNAVQQGAFTLAVEPATLSLQQGGSGSVRAQIQRSGGFTGAVAITATGMPAGVTLTLPAQPVALDTVTIPVAVAASAAPGTATITLTGSAQGLPSRTATLQLTVTAAPAGGFTLSISPASVSVVQGGTATATVTITRTGGFADAVTLAVSGAPAGMTATLNPATTTGATSALSLAVGGSVAAGSYTLTITGTAAGQANQTATLAVQVTAPPSGNTVTWQACDDSPPLWVAYQNEGGAWTQVQPTGTTYTFSIGARGGVAVVEQSGGSFELSLVYASGSELVSFGTGSCALEAGGKRLTGSVAGLEATDLAQVQMGSAFALVQPLSTSFTLTGVADGPQDLVATRQRLNISGSDVTRVVNRFIIRRGLNLPDNGTIAPLDFNAAEAFDPVVRALTLAGLGGDSALVSTSYLTAAGAGTSFLTGFFGYSSDLPSTATARSYYGVPAAQQAAGDLHMLSGFAFGAGGFGGDSLIYRAASSLFQEAADRTLTFGPALVRPTLTSAATAPYLRLRAQLARQAEYDRLAMFSLQQTANGVSILVTAGYTGGADPWDVTIPELSGAGFNAAWGLQPGAAVEWTASAFGWTGAGLVFLNPVSGTTSQFAARGGRLNP